MTLLNDEIIEVTPFAVTAGHGVRPIMVFKDKQGLVNVPIWLHPFEAGLMMAQANSLEPPYTPHKVLLKLMEQMQLVAEKCIFTHVKGHYQYVDLFFKRIDQIEKMEFRAADAVSLCMFLKIPFYCTKEFISQSQQLEADQTDFVNQVRVNPDIVRRKLNQYLN